MAGRAGNKNPVQTKILGLNGRGFFIWKSFVCLWSLTQFEFRRSIVYSLSGELNCAGAIFPGFFM
jgi:hypothetical protein